MVLKSVIIWWVVCLSLSLASQALVRFMVSCFLNGNINIQVFYIKREEPVLGVNA